MAVKFSEMGGIAFSRIGSHYCLAQKRLIQGDLAGAVSEMNLTDQAALDPTATPTAKAMHAAWRVMFAFAQGDLETALAWGDRLSEYPVDVVPLSHRHILGRLLLAKGEKTAAAQQLRHHYEDVTKHGAQGLAIITRTYQALAAETPTEALTFLSEALKLGEPEGFIRTFADEGALLKPLLRRALSQGITPEYTAKLLGIIEAEERRRGARQGAAVPLPESSDLLSQREIEVLRLVAAGLSNQEIAVRLTLSLSTAKTHVHHVFEKLNARDRLQAVTRARELRLI